MFPDSTHIVAYDDVEVLPEMHSPTASIGNLIQGTQNAHAAKFHKQRARWEVEEALGL